MFQFDCPMSALPRAVPTPTLEALGGRGPAPNGSMRNRKFYDRSALYAKVVKRFGKRHLILCYLFPRLLR